MKLLDQQVNKIVRLTASSSVLQAGRGQAGAKQIRGGSTQHRWLEREVHEGAGGESVEEATARSVSPALGMGGLKAHGGLQPENQIVELLLTVLSNQALNLSEPQFLHFII